MGTMEDEAASSSGRSKLHNIKLRVFSGERKEYEDIKREWQAVQVLHGVDDEKFAPLVYLALAPGPDKPRELVAHLDLNTEI